MITSEGSRFLGRGAAECAEKTVVFLVDVWYPYRHDVYIYNCIYIYCTKNNIYVIVIVLDITYIYICGYNNNDNDNDRRNNINIIILLTYCITTMNNSNFMQHCNDTR